MLDPGYWKEGGPNKVAAENFLADIQQAIVKYLDEQDQDARESAAEARIQAMRDNE